MQAPGSRFGLPLVGLLLLACVCTASAQSVDPDPLELRVESVGSVTLAGALYLPAGDGPFPAVVITHGSEAGGRTQPGYVRWAEQIRARGLAALIFDKRGVGDSEGTYVEAPDLSIPAADVLAWYELLKTRTDLVPDRIGVLGWSQGGWTGPLAASQSDLAFVVMISGPAVTPLEQNIFDKVNRVTVAAPSAEAAAAAESAIRLVLTYLLKGDGRDAAQEAWDAVAGEDWFTDNYRFFPMMDRYALLSDPRGQEFFEHNSYEPTCVLRKLRVPVLAVYGGADRIVPVQRSLRLLRSALSGGEATLTYHVFPGADHGIGVRSADGSRRNAAGYPGIVLDWIEEVTR